MATVVAAAALILGVPERASDAGQSSNSIKIAFVDGRVSLVAEEALASEVLAEWARYGKTEVLGAELLERKVVTVMLEEVSDGEALDAILGRGSPTWTVPRRSEPGLSGFARLLRSATRRSRPKNRSAGRPPEVRYAHVVPDKVLSGEDYGKPVFETLKELPPAPETRFAHAGESHGGLWLAGVRAARPALGDSGEALRALLEGLSQVRSRLQQRGRRRPIPRCVSALLIAGSKAAPCW